MEFEPSSDEESSEDGAMAEEQTATSEDAEENTSALSEIGVLGDDEIPSFSRWQEIIAGLVDDDSTEGQSLFSTPLIRRVEEIYSKIIGPNDEQF